MSWVGMSRTFSNFFRPFELAELDGRAGALIVDRIELVILDQLGIEADILLPFVKQIFPVVEIGDALRHDSSLMSCRFCRTAKGCQRNWPELIARAMPDVNRRNERSNRSFSDDRSENFLSIGIGVEILLTIKNALVTLSDGCETQLRRYVQWIELSLWSR